VTVNRVAIAEEVGRGEVVREGVHELLGGPVGSGVFGHVEVDDAPAMVNEHDENEEDAQARGGNREKVEGDQISDMVREERPPRLRRLGTPLRHQPGDGSLGHVDTELQELAMDSWGAPEGVRGGHAGDQSLDLGMDGRATSGRAARELAPVLAEAAPLPAQDGVGGDDHEGLPPPGPDSSQPDPEEAIRRAQLGSAVVLLYTASCCRRARFSIASWRWPPKRNGRSRSTWSKRVIIESRFSPDQRPQINDLPPAEVLAKDRRSGSRRSMNVIIEL